MKQSECCGLILVAIVFLYSHKETRHVEITVLC